MKRERDELTVLNRPVMNRPVMKWLVTDKLISANTMIYLSPNFKYFTDISQTTCFAYQTISGQNKTEKPHLHCMAQVAK